MICTNKQMVMILALYAIDKAVETWLGKTKSVKAGSILELLWSLVKNTFTFLSNSTKEK